MANEVVKLSEKTTVDQLSNTEYLIGIDANKKVVKIEKQKAYPVVTNTVSGLMSASDKALSPVRKLSGSIDRTYLLAESTTSQAAISFFVDMMRIEGSYGNLFYFTGSTATAGALYCKVNKIFRNGSYPISFFYKKAGSVLSLYVKITQYHALTVVPLSSVSFNVKMEEVTLPSDAIEIPIE